MSRGAEDFLRVLLRFVPPDAREGVREIFRAGRELSSENDINVFLMLCAETGPGWLALMPKAAPTAQGEAARGDGRGEFASGGVGGTDAQHTDGAPASPERSEGATR